jgi:hypothetical protein
LQTRLSIFAFVAAQKNNSSFDVAEKVSIERDVFIFLGVLRQIEEIENSKFCLVEKKCLCQNFIFHNHRIFVKNLVTDNLSLLF